MVEHRTLLVVGPVSDKLAQNCSRRILAMELQDPEKPITVVIPLGPGGSHDLNARVITSTIPQYLGQAMIVQLSPGAGGQKGTQEVANAEPDGYTLIFNKFESGLVFALDNADITNLILQRFDSATAAAEESAN